MTNLESIGKIIVIMGFVFAFVGGAIWLASKIPGLEKIPGTIKISTTNTTCLIPILASIILSLVLTIVLNLVLRFLNR